MNSVILILLLILLIIDIIWSVYGFTTDIREQRQLKVDECVRKMTKLNSMNSNTGVFPKIWEIKQPGDNSNFLLQQRVNELEKEVKNLKNQIKNIETLCKKNENLI